MKKHRLKTRFILTMLVCILVNTSLLSQDIIVNTGLIQTPIQKSNLILKDVDYSEADSKDFFKHFSIFNKTTSPNLMQRDSFDLSLSKRFPPHLDQKNTKACVTFVLSYALKTYQESSELGYSIYDDNNNTIDSLIFSPSYLFNVIKQGTNCNTGITLPDALNSLEIFGSISIKKAPFNVDDLNQNCIEPEATIIGEGKKFRIANYYRLSKSKRSNPEEFNSKKLDIIERIKKRITERIPIVFGSYLNNQFIFNEYELFHNDGLPIWNSSKKITNSYHAMLIVGYNDKIQSFKVYNSFGDYGFIWMKYDVFKKLTTFDFYAVYDVPYRQQNEDQLFAKTEKYFNWNSLKSFGLSNENFTLSTKINEHYYVENERYKLSNLKMDNEINQVTIEVVDKTLKTQPLIFAINLKEVVTFSVLDKDFSLRIDKTDTKNQIASITMSVKSHPPAILYNLQDKYPIELVDWNSEKIDEKEYRFKKVNATLSIDGIFTVIAEQITKSDSSWHGILSFDILDSNNKIIYNIQTPGFAQNGIRETKGPENKQDIAFETFIENEEILENAYSIRPSAYRE